MPVETSSCYNLDIKCGDAIFFLRLLFISRGYIDSVFLNFIAQTHSILSSTVRQYIYVYPTPLYKTAFTSRVKGHDMLWYASGNFVRYIKRTDELGMRISWHHRPIAGVIIEVDIRRSAYAFCETYKSNCTFTKRLICICESMTRIVLRFALKVEN